MKGTTVPCSPMRRLLWDLLRAAANVPAITVQRTMRLPGVIAARNARTDHPPLSAVFVKGYALVAREREELRRAYLAFPRGRLRQYPHSIANIAVTRMWAGHDTVFHLLIGHAAELSVVEIASRIRRAQTAAIGEIPEFSRAVKFAALPGPLRRLALWLGLNLGWKRARFFGTFGLSTVTSFGAELINVIWPTGTVLTYGMLAPDGTIDVRLVFDHRIADAAVMAQALTRLEAVLNGAVADELREVPPLPQAGADGPQEPFDTPGGLP
jgi:hypothetical protein